MTLLYCSRKTVKAMSAIAAPTFDLTPDLTRYGLIILDTQVALIYPRHSVSPDATFVQPHLGTDR